MNNYLILPGNPNLSRSDVRDMFHRAVDAGFIPSGVKNLKLFMEMKDAITMEEALAKSMPWYDEAQVYHLHTPGQEITTVLDIPEDDGMLDHGSARALAMSQIMEKLDDEVEVISAQRLPITKRDFSMENHSGAKRYALLVKGKRTKSGLSHGEALTAAQESAARLQKKTQEGVELPDILVVQEMEVMRPVVLRSWRVIHRAPSPNSIIFIW